MDASSRGYCYGDLVGKDEHLGYGKNRKIAYWRKKSEIPKRIINKLFKERSEMSEKLSDEELQRIIKRHGNSTVGEIIKNVNVVGLMALELQERRASDAIPSESTQMGGSEEELKKEELDGLETEANHLIKNVDGLMGQKAFLRLDLQFALRWVREHRRLQLLSRVLPSTDAAREWISVSEKYPDRYINVLCCLKSKSGFIAPMVGKLRNNGRFSCEIYENELPIVVVTHWQEIKLPQPPKE